jgi:hypothetical protein
MVIGIQILISLYCIDLIKKDHLNFNIFKEVNFLPLLICSKFFSLPVQFVFGQCSFSILNCRLMNKKILNLYLLKNAENKEFYVF